MAIEIYMPKLSDTMNEATLLEWLVAVGDTIERGKVIAEVKSGKAIMPMEASDSGVVEALHVAAGATVAVGALLVSVGGDAGNGPAVKLPVQSVAAEMPSRGSDGPIVSPAAEASSGKSVKIRRLVARKMEQAWRTIPHFYVTMPVDMTDVIRIRKDLGVTINDFVLAATARALQEHPWVNATWNGEQGVELPDINLVMAVATDRGLYNPVIHNCENLSLKQLSGKARELANKAANQGELQPQEMEGGTFTITNMGMLGVESFGAIITPPQAAVLSVGTVKGEIVVDEQGEPAVATMMRLTLSADHRVLDGADAAEFLDTVKSYLEAPIMLVSE